MDQAKIGCFLKELRKERNITQEDLADKMNVSRRTVSRWETGSNLPDLAILVELADFYDVDLREIFNGERKKDEMDPELKETLMMAADYTAQAKAIWLKHVNRMFIVAGLAGIALLILIFLPEDTALGHIFDFIKGMLTGIVIGMCWIGIIATGPLADKVAEIKAGFMENKK